MEEWTVFVTYRNGLLLFPFVALYFDCSNEFSTRNQPVNRETKFWVDKEFFHLFFFVCFLTTRISPLHVQISRLNKKKCTREWAITFPQQQSFYSNQLWHKIGCLTKRCYDKVPPSSQTKRQVRITCKIPPDKLKKKMTFSFLKDKVSHLMAFRHPNTLRQ